MEWRCSYLKKNRIYFFSKWRCSFRRSFSTSIHYLNILTHVNWTRKFSGTFRCQYFRFMNWSSPSFVYFSFFFFFFSSILHLLYLQSKFLRLMWVDVLEWVNSHAIQYDHEYVHISSVLSYDTQCVKNWFCVVFVCVYSKWGNTNVFDLRKWVFKR